MHLRLCAAAIASLAASTQASIVGSADLTPTPLGGGLYHYDAAVHNTGTTKIAAFWFAWVPGANFMSVAPTNVQSPPGWTFTISNEGGATDGFGIEWTTTTANALNTSSSLSGFGFDTTETPAALTGFSAKHPTYRATTSFLYVGTPLLTQGVQIIASVVPAPSTAAWVLAAALAAGRRRRV